MSEITFTLMTCGELTEKECRHALGPNKKMINGDWGPELFKFNEVRNVYPASNALNKMIDQCNTKYLVPLDSDMILNKGCLDRINDAIKRSDGMNWHSILFPLWDTLTQEKIMALKVFKTSVVKEIRYKDLPCPDIQHYKDLTNAGYQAVNLMHEESIGEHRVKGCFFCYAKYKDLYKVTRTYPDVILESLFKGGTDLKSRANAHYDFFCARYEETRNPDYLYCIAGMVDGLTAILDHGSKNLGDGDMLIHVEDAKRLFNKWAGKIKLFI